MTGGTVADGVYDLVGGAYAEVALRATTRRGRYLVIGFGPGEIPKIPPALALYNEREILGVFLGDAVHCGPAVHLANLKQLAEWFAAGKLRPAISVRIPLGQTRATIKRQAMGKLVVLPEV